RAKLDAAIASLQASVNSSLWIDQTHLQPATGQTVFADERDAVKSLQDLLKNKKSTIPDSALQGPIDRIMKADRLLAEVAVNAAIAAGGLSDLIADAQRELGMGDTDRSNARFDQAVGHYGLAWKHAQQAVGN